MQLKPAISQKVLSSTPSHNKVEDKRQVKFQSNNNVSIQPMINPVVKSTLNVDIKEADGVSQRHSRSKSAGNLS
jgi:hypothetical protein